MIQLAFTSCSVGPLSEARLHGLIAECRANNRRHGITGVMVAGGNRFAEIIEGEEAVIRPLFGRICHDDRHHAIVLLGQGRIERRSFGGHPLG